MLGAWSPGVWNAGRLGLAVNVAAAAWLTFEIVNIAWPRLPDAPWYVNYGAALMVLIVALGGVLVRVGMGRSARPMRVPEGVAKEAT